MVMLTVLLARYYPEPKDKVSHIKNYVAFYKVKHSLITAINVRAKAKPT